MKIFFGILILFSMARVQAENLPIFDSATSTEVLQYGWAYSDGPKVFLITPESSNLNPTTWTLHRGLKSRMNLHVAQPLRGYQVFELESVRSADFSSWETYQKQVVSARRNQELSWEGNSGTVLGIQSKRHRYLTPITVTEAIVKEKLKPTDLGRAVWNSDGQILGFVSNLVYVEQAGSQTLELPFNEYFEKTRRLSLISWRDISVPNAVDLDWNARNDKGWWIDAGRFEFQEKCDWILRNPQDGPIGGADGWGIGGADGWGIGGLRSQTPCQILVRQKQGDSVFSPEIEETWIRGLNQQSPLSLSLKVNMAKEGPPSERYNVQRWTGITELVLSLSKPNHSHVYPVNWIDSQSKCLTKVVRAADELQKRLKDHFDRLPKVSHKIIFVHFLLRAQLAQTSHWSLLRGDAIYELPRGIAPVFWERDLEPDLARKLEALLWNLKEEARDCRDSP